MKRKNIAPAPFPEPAGTDEESRAQHVFQVYRYANAKAEDAIGWYFSRKKAKEGMASALRFAAILFTTLGGLIPLLVASGVLNSEVTGIATKIEYGQFGYVSLALAAACVGLDKFFGYSSGWMRYVTTALKLQKMREEFNVDWAILLSSIQSPTPSSTERETMLKRVQTFLQAVMAEVESETAAWAAEYRTHLSDLEKSARQQLETIKPGVINLTVANARQFAGGVTVLLDEVPRQTITSNECQLSPVFPGDHLVKVQAMVAGKLVTAGAPVRLEAGQSITLALSLPPS